MFVFTIGGVFSAFSGCRNTENRLDPMETSGSDIVSWLIRKSEETHFPSMIEADLNAIKCFWRDIPIITAVTKGLLKIMEAQDLNCLGI